MNRLESKVVRVVDNQKPETGGSQDGTATYIAPALEVLGTVEQLTQGPDPDTGDVPTGVISF